MALPRGKKAYLQGEVIFDVTDTTAVASDVAQGKIFYDADGVRTEGTASGSTGYSMDDFLSRNVITEITAEDLDEIVDGVSETFYNTPWNNGGLEGMFASQSSLEEISLPNSLLAVPSFFCYDCKNLTTINFAENPTGEHFKIGAGAFQNCISLTEITIPSYVRELHEYAFEYCTSLTTVNFESNMSGNYIDDQAFAHCPLLTTINFNGTRQEWIEYSNTQDGNIFDAVNATVYCSDGNLVFNQPVGNVQVTYADDTTELIPVGVRFSAGTVPRENGNGSAPVSIVIPEGVTEIGDYALISYDDLTSLTLPSTLTTIGNLAISGNSLMSLTIPVNVTNLVSFDGNCIMINGSGNLTFLSTTVPNGFGGCYFNNGDWSIGTFTISVPSASVTDYKNEANFGVSSRIQAIQ